MKIRFHEDTEVSLWRGDTCLEDEHLVSGGEEIEVSEVYAHPDDDPWTTIYLPNGTQMAYVDKSFYEVIEGD